MVTIKIPADQNRAIETGDQISQARYLETKSTIKPIKNVTGEC